MAYLGLPVPSQFMRQHGKLLISRPNREDRLIRKEPIAASKIIPLIDREPPLSDVDETGRHAEQGHGRGGPHSRHEEAVHAPEPSK